MASPAVSSSPSPHSSPTTPLFEAGGTQQFQFFRGGHFSQDAQQPNLFTAFPQSTHSSLRTDDRPCDARKSQAGSTSASKGSLKPTDAVGIKAKKSKKRRSSKSPSSRRKSSRSPVASPSPVVPQEKSASEVLRKRAKKEASSENSSCPAVVRKRKHKRTLEEKARHASEAIRPEKHKLRLKLKHTNSEDDLYGKVDSFLVKHKLKKKSKTFGGVKPTNRVALTISEDQFVTEELEQIEKSRSTQRAASARERKPKKGTRLLTYSSTLPSNFKLHDAAANLTSGGVSFLERSGAYGGGVTVPMTQTELEFVTMPKCAQRPKRTTSAEALNIGPNIGSDNGKKKKKKEKDKEKRSKSTKKSKSKKEKQAKERPRAPEPPMPTMTSQTEFCSLPMAMSSMPSPKGNRVIRPMSARHIPLQCDEGRVSPRIGTPSPPIMSPRSAFVGIPIGSPQRRRCATLSSMPRKSADSAFLASLKESKDGKIDYTKTR